MATSPAQRSRQITPRPKFQIWLSLCIEKGVLFLLVCVWLFPLLWLFLTSLKTRTLVANRTPAFLFPPTMSNYVNLFVEFEFLHFLISSIIIAAGTTLGVIAIGSICAYPLSRLRFRGAKQISLWILSLYMMPSIAVALPFYLLFFKLKLLDTHLAVIISHLSFLLPFGIWLLRGFFADIPRELDEAAMLDGCSHFKLLCFVIAPTARAGMAVTAIFVFVFSWNEFLLAFMLTQRVAQTVPIRLASMVLPQATRWGELSAGTVVTLGPLFLAVLLLQRHIVRGMTLGALR
jgi:multiple sugar transport system permease protein